VLRLNQRRLYALAERELSSEYGAEGLDAGTG
jgi:hypothetical protein